MISNVARKCSTNLKISITFCADKKGKHSMWGQTASEMHCNIEGLFKNVNRFCTVERIHLWVHFIDSLP